MRGDHGRARGEGGLVPYLAIAAGVLCGTAIGFFQGSIFTRFGIASFVVTLAGLLAWPGFQLEVLGETGTVNITDPKITGLTNTFYSDTVGWIIAILAIAAFAGFGFMARQRACGGPAGAAHFDASDPHRAGGGGGAGGHLGPERRSRVLPLALILVGFVLLFFFITTKTTSAGTSSPWAGTPRRRRAGSTSSGCA